MGRALKTVLSNTYVGSLAALAWVGDPWIVFLFFLSFAISAGIAFAVSNLGYRYAPLAALFAWVGFLSVTAGALLRGGALGSVFGVVSLAIALGAANVAAWRAKVEPPFELTPQDRLRRAGGVAALGFFSGLATMIAGGLIGALGATREMVVSGAVPEVFVRTIAVTLITGLVLMIVGYAAMRRLVPDTQPKNP